MAKIGRKIYYELSTGNVILDTGERQGDVIETTEEQDFSMFSALQSYQTTAVGVLQLDFGQDKDSFSKYPYHINTANNAIIWDTANPYGASLDEVKAAKIAQLNDMYQQTLANGFKVTVNGIDYVCGCSTEDKANLNSVETAIAKGFVSFPIAYASVNGTPIPLNSQADLDIIEETATRFAFAQHQQILSLVGQVKASTTNENGEVDAIQWTPETY